ncbi:MAG TPA: four helix bundle protein [Opitutus sp.]|nr:four helix bundle protein [Opitutus sp.]
MKDHRQLEVWQRGHELTLRIYEITKTFPKEELFGLTSQLRRAAFSIPANIVEGCGRDSDAELKRFIDIAHGSAAETEYFLLLSSDLNLIATANYSPLADEISQIKRMLGALARKLKADR